MTEESGARQVPWAQAMLCVTAVILLVFGQASVRALRSSSSQPTHHTINLQVPPPDCQRVKCIALTFDDGPNPATTPKVLDTLEGEHVPATFFVVGSRVAPNARLIARMHAAHFEIGNHSWSHPDLTELTPKQIRAQITKTQLAIEKAGAPAPTLFRPPYGYIDKKIRANVHLTFMFWNEDPEDWNADKASQVAARVIRDARPGGVVDMHDIYDVTADALPTVLRGLKGQGFHFVTASQLLDLRPGQSGMFYGHP